jgi:hypothetical protein
MFLILIVVHQAWWKLRGHLALAGEPSVYHQEMLLSLCRMGVVYDEAATKTSTECGCSNHLYLSSRLWIELQCCPRPALQGGEKAREEFPQTFEGFMAFSVNVAKPLQGGYRNCAIECARSETERLASICLYKVALDFSFRGDLEHGRRDVVTDPQMTSVAYGLSADPRSASNLQQEARAVWKQDQLQATFRHLSLDVYHTTACRIFA